MKALGHAYKLCRTKRQCFMPTLWRTYLRALPFSNASRGSQCLATVVLAPIFSSRTRFWLSNGSATNGAYGVNTAVTGRLSCCLAARFKLPKQVCITNSRVSELWQFTLRSLTSTKSNDDVPCKVAVTTKASQKCQATLTAR